MQQDQGGIENMIPPEPCEIKTMKTPINIIAEELNSVREHSDLIPGNLGLIAYPRDNMGIIAGYLNYPRDYCGAIVERLKRGVGIIKI